MTGPDVGQHLASLHREFKDSLVEQRRAIMGITDRLIASSGPGEERNRDLRSLAELAHKLAGGGGTFGMPTITKAARALEASARQVMNDPGAPFVPAETDALLEALATEGGVGAGGAHELQAVTETARILIVDDDVILVKVASLYLEKAGYQVDSCTNAADLLTRLEAARPSLILLDYQLDGRTGLELLEELRKLDSGASVPVVFCSGISDADLQQALIDAGAAGFVEKPFKAAGLVAAVERALV